MPTYKFTLPEPIKLCFTCKFLSFNQTEFFCKINPNTGHNPQIRPTDCPLQEVPDEPVNP